MSGYLLDTNVVSELRKGARTDIGVSSWLADNETEELWLSVIVVAELQRGIALAERRDPAQAESLQEWLDNLVNQYDDRVLPISREVAIRWGSLGIPDPLPILDGLIAATALEHGLIVVTRNVADIARSGVPVLNPFI